MTSVIDYAKIDDGRQFTRFATFVRRVIVTGTVLFPVGTSFVFSYVLAINNVPRIIGGWIVGLSNSALMFLFLCNLAFIILGAVLEGLPAMLILTPIFLPFFSQFEVNPIHFGVLIVYSMGIGFFLPPIGVGIFIASTFAKLDLGKVIVPFMPYFIAFIIGLIICFPMVHNLSSQYVL